MSKRGLRKALLVIIFIAASVATYLQYQIVSDGAYMDRLELTGDDTMQWLSFVFAAVLAITTLGIIIRFAAKRKTKK